MHCEKVPDHKTVTLLSIQKNYCRRFVSLLAGFLVSRHLDLQMEGYKKMAVGVEREELPIKLKGNKIFGILFSSKTCGKTWYTMKMI